VAERRRLQCRDHRVLWPEIGRAIRGADLGHDLLVAGNERQALGLDRLEMGAARHHRHLVAGLGKARCEISADRACSKYANTHQSFSLFRYRRGKAREEEMAQEATRGEYRGLYHRRAGALAAWLAKRPPEKALEPDLPIVDPHHHLWDAPERERDLY